MAMSTRLQLVSAPEIGALKQTPTSIITLDKPKDQSYETYFACSINYFLAGDPYPDKVDHPLGAMLFGSESVDCPTLENGNFGIVPPGEVGAIATSLAKVDLKKVAKAVEDADADELADNVRALAAFYQRAADRKLGVVMYTS